MVNIQKFFQYIEDNEPTPTQLRQWGKCQNYSDERVWQLLIFSLRDNELILTPDRKLRIPHD